MESQTNHNDSASRIVQVTPSGRGAIASLLLDGDSAIQHAERFFRSASGKPLSDYSRGHIAFGRWVTRDDQAGEELIVCCMSDHEVEIHCHGGRAAIDAIAQSLVGAGCVAVPWSEFALNSIDDPIAAEARVALANAPTQRAAGILLDQLHGALAAALRQAESSITAGQLPEAMEQLTSLQRRAAWGLHLIDPFRVVIAGRPNVGKSSLVNAILGYGRAIVFDQPGTTRDLLTATTALEGWPVELIDTAGVRTSEDDIEKQGIARARQAMRDADLIVLLIDASQPRTDEDHELIDAVKNAPAPMFIAYNKCDLPSALGSQASPDISISATTGENVPQLLALLVERLVGIAPTDGEAIPFTLRQLQQIESAIACLDDGDTTGAADSIARCRANTGGD